MANQCPTSLHVTDSQKYLGVDLNYFSENFQSVATETTRFEPLVNQSADSTSLKALQKPSAKQKPSWDMSCGNWLGADFTGVVIKLGGFARVAVKSGDIEKNAIANAVWNRTSFIDTHIADIVFTGAMEDCYFENCAFTRVSFKNATLINNSLKIKV